MYDDQHAPRPQRVVGDAPQRVDDPFLGREVEVLGGFVEQQQAGAPGAAQQRPGQRHPLPLPGGDARTVLAEQQRRVQLVRGGRGQRVGDLRVGGSRYAESDVVRHRSRDQRRSLRDPADLFPPRHRVALGEVDGADPDPAGGGGREAQHRGEQAGLSDPGRADHRDQLPRRDP